MKLRNVFYYVLTAIGFAISPLTNAQVTQNSFSWTDDSADDTRLLNAVVNNRSTNANGAGSVVGYFTNYKSNVGPGFGIVSEIQDFSGIGPFWGMEIDAMSHGSGITKDTMSRRGLGVVIGRAGGNDATIGYGVDVIPAWWDYGKVDVAYGVNVGIHCRIACVSVPVDEKITLSGNGVISLRYNSTTNAVEFLRNDVVKFSINMGVN